MPIDGEKLALAMLVSISEGLCLEGLLGAILFRALADMSAAGEVSCRLVEGKLRDVECKLEVRAWQTS
jgi:hypothetical protein